MLILKTVQSHTCKNGNSIIKIILPLPSVPPLCLFLAAPSASAREKEQEKAYYVVRISLNYVLKNRLIIMYSGISE